MKKQSGAVLLITLGFLGIVSLLLTYSLHSVYLQKELNHSYRQQLILEQAAKKGINVVFQALKNKKPCRRSIISDSGLLEKTKRWWNSVCHAQIEQVRLNYFFTKLQTTPCIYLKQKSVTFWQLTVKATLKSQASQMIEATVAMPNKEMLQCESRKQYLQRQWQSIRLLRG